MKQASPDAGYRQPQALGVDADPLDEVLARELYEARLEESARAELEKARAVAAAEEKLRRRRRRVQMSMTGEYPTLRIKRTRGDTMSDVALAICFAILFGTVIGGVFALAVAVSSTFLMFFGWALTLATLGFGVLVAKAAFKYFRNGALHLRLTPHHFVAYRGGTRCVGERDEIKLEVRDDSVRMKSAGHDFRFDELAPADVAALLDFASRCHIPVR